jgi:two-component system, OmpR family, phosphate regulon sensor histidine kinase PhoR
MRHLRDILGHRILFILVGLAALTSAVAAVSSGIVSAGVALVLLALAGAFTVWTIAATEGIVPSQAPSAARRAEEGADISWRSVVDALPDPALVLSDAGRVLHASRAGRELFPNLAVGQQIEQVTRNPELLAAVEQVMATRSVRIVQSFERIPVERRLAVTVSPLQSAGAGAGAPAIFLVFKDITEEERLAQMRSDFIAYASHELRTPLTSLRGFIETLQGQARDDPSARQQFLEIMASQAGRMSRLLDDLLSLSRLEMRAHVPPRGDVEINEIAREVTDLLQPIADEAGIALSFKPAPAPCRVRGDRDELVQVFQNLVQNAIKYGRRGGHVDVTVTREPGAGASAARVVVDVQDDGPGIAEEHLPRLTERFYRVDVAESRDKGGTGLGLAIVKHVLNRHNGQLRIRSQVGVGSTFSVWLDALPA